MFKYDSGHAVINLKMKLNPSVHQSICFIHILLSWGDVSNHKDNTTHILCQNFWGSSIQVMGFHGKLTLRFFKFIEIVFRFPVGIVESSVKGSIDEVPKYTTETSPSPQTGYMLYIWCGVPVLWLVWKTVLQQEYKCWKNPSRGHLKRIHAGS